MDYLPQNYIFTTDGWQYGKLQLKDRARGMRQVPTEAEAVLWRAVRGGQVGAKFRRQHVIDRYIGDFVSIGPKLVVEADGGGHDDPEQRDYDNGRTARLEELGYRVLRFSNEQILTKLPEVLAAVRAAVGPGDEAPARAD